MEKMNTVDAIYKKMKDDTEALPPKLGESQIQKFFTTKTIFVSGATGFMGKAVVEKLLRGCKDLKKVYILFTPDDGSNLQDTFKKYCGDVVFDMLRKSKIDFVQKLAPIEGNLKVPDLGLQENDRTRIINEVDIIYQIGSDLKFGETMPESIKKEFFGTKAVMELALKCSHLVSFIYVSTAYSHSYKSDIDEAFYPPPADEKMAEDIIRASTENKSGLNDDAVPGFLGQWPNVYTFTKSATEDLVRVYGRKATFSCAVFRPSIVVPSYKEPFSGWVSDCNGPGCAFAAVGLGYLRMGFSKENPFDIVPVDMSTNALLAITWDIVKNKKHDDIAVFNYASGKVNPVTLKRMYNGVIPWAREEPSIKSIWYPKVFITSCMVMFLLGHITMHVLPAMFIDIVHVLRGNFKPCLTAKVLKSQKMADALFHFSVTAFNIDVKQMAKVWDRMVPADQELFFCDLRELNWDEFWPSFWRGIRIFLIKDPMDTIEEARKRHCKLAVIHYAVTAAVTIFLLYWSCGFTCNILHYLFK